MLADLTGIKVVYDFRSAPLIAGFDGAPLVPPHNAHIAATEGDGCYYNGGNTSNFAWIIDGKAQIGADAGPFNEYIDNFIRDNTADSFDVDGKYGKNVQNKKTGFPYQALYSYKLIFRFTTEAGMLGYLDGREFTAQDVWFLDEFRAFPK